MQSTSTTWKNLWATGTARTIPVLELGGSGTIALGDIVSIKLSSVLFPNDDLGLGCVSTRKLELELLLDNYTAPNRRGVVLLSIKLTNGTTTTSSIPKGAYRIDTRETDVVSGITKLVCYDTMVDMNAVCPYSTSGWTSEEMVNHICSRTGFTLDSRSGAIIDNFRYFDFKGYKYRDMLSYVGVLSCGNWVITDNTELRLIPVGNPYTYVSQGKADYIQIDNSQIVSYKRGTKYPSADYVRVYYNKDDTSSYYEAGTEDEYNFEFYCPLASTATYIRTRLNNLLEYAGYTPCTMKLRIDPAAEVGDYLGFDAEMTESTSLVHQIASETIYVDELCMREIEVPSSGDLLHEYLSAE